MEGDEALRAVVRGGEVSWERAGLLDRVLFLLRDNPAASLTELMCATSLAASDPFRRRCRLRLAAAATPAENLAVIADCVARRAVGVPALTSPTLRRREGLHAAPERLSGAAPV